ncbi:SAM-dependent methyltransferase [Streptomyces fragilis]|uniref:SAM-dependent methyltransferase n=2 Tax=Streptomyces fragilis TaxID=67301 RepID=A0ABV2YL39_9ACTN|nr:SAM-dependent methyltransferase [Streptomyces fragilis]
MPRGRGCPMSDDVWRRIDTSRPHPARVYDLLLGGKDHYEVDRAAAAAACRAHPRGYLDVRHNRDFLRRAVTSLARDEGLDQFLDIGSGLPTQENVHQIAQRFVPSARVVYADNDPIVLAHARALLTSSPEGRTAYVEGDLRAADALLEQASATLDLDRPVVLVLAAVLHFVEDADAHGVVKRLTDALPSGSRVVLSHLCHDLNPERILPVARTMRERGMTFVLRDRAGVERFFDANGLVVEEPGIVPVHRWRPDGAAPVPEQPAPELLASMEPVDRLRYADINDVTDEDISVYGAVGRKP